MQIIQTIRDKGAVIVIVVIALSLIGFILMDSRTGSNNAAGSLASSVGTINGNTVELGAYNTRVDQMIAQQEQQRRQSLSSEEKNQMRDNAWQQIVAENIFYEEAEKLGIALTPKELNNILLSNDPQNPFLREQSLLDSATGRLDVAKAQEAMKNIKKFTGVQKETVNAELIEPLRLTSVAAKYTGLIAAGSYYANWMKERDLAMASKFAVIQYVAVPYNVISDSSVTISDAEISAYVDKNKSMFKQEAGRKISYVTFSQLPSKADSAAQYEAINTLKNDFASDSNTAAFLARNGSAMEFTDAYLPKSKIQSTQLDTILTYPQGTVVGPYVDNGSYILAKVLGAKSLPDSVSARHILIATNNPQTGAATRDEASAKKLADSIAGLISAGADFNLLAAQFSDDASNKLQGGDLKTFGYGQMVPEFNEFVFTKPVGTTDVVKTQFGYHIVKVTSQSNFNNAYKIAFLAKDIAATEPTITQANTQASKASATKTREALQAYATKNGLGITVEPALVKETDFVVGNLKDARQLVKWAFEAEKGDVSEPFNIGDDFVVASVDKIEKEGLQDAATARASVEVILRNEKKAEMIKTKIGNNPTLESVAGIYQKTIETAGADSTLTMSAKMINGVGIEPKIVGAAFHNGFLTKVSPLISGTNGVYIIKVISVSPDAPMAPEQLAQSVETNRAAYKALSGNWFESLRTQAEVKDKRGKYM